MRPSPRLVYMCTTLSSSNTPYSCAFLCNATLFFLPESQKVIVGITVSYSVIHPNLVLVCDNHKAPFNNKLYIENYHENPMLSNKCSADSNEILFCRKFRKILSSE